MTAPAPRPVRPGMLVNLKVNGTRYEGYVRAELNRDPGLACVHVEPLRRVLHVPWDQLTEVQD